MRALHRDERWKAISTWFPGILWKTTCTHSISANFFCVFLSLPWNDVKWSKLRFPNGRFLKRWCVIIMIYNSVLEKKKHHKQFWSVFKRITFFQWKILFVWLCDLCMFKNSTIQWIKMLLQCNVTVLILFYRRD